MIEHISFLIWASWVWKTTLIKWLDALNVWLICLNADARYGIPDEETMISESGSVGERRNQSLEKCLVRVMQEFPWKHILIDKSAHVLNIQDVCKKLWIDDYEIILIDCEEEEMKRRLLEERNQPELVTDDMFNRQRVLRIEAKEKWFFCIDTRHATQDEIVDICKTHLFL